jgi:iron complex outermembrane receptor protein
MKAMLNRFITPLVALLAATVAAAQPAQVGGSIYADGEPIVGATVRLEETRLGAVSDRDGRFLIRNVPAGSYRLTISSIGYGSIDTTITLQSGDSLHLDLLMEAEVSESEEIVVTGTRTQRGIADVPVRIEAVPQEEVEEKIMMSPSSVAMLLNESTGMRVQTTSPTSNTANLRIQGLPGRYTQLLIDGIPNVGGLSAGFGLTELPPLNLRQVEVIKGAASALYGADAISGVVNFITKDPAEDAEVNALANYTTQGGLDLAAFYGERFGDFGMTVLASFDRQPRFDVDGDRFADVTGYDRFSIYPKFTLRLGEQFRLEASLGALSEDRLGGAVDASRDAIGSEAPYLENVLSKRISGSMQLFWNDGASQSAVVKVAAMRLQRDALYGSAPFNATQKLVYADAQYTIEAGNHNLLFGASFNLDDFHDATPGIADDRSYSYNVPSLLLQDELTFGREFTILASGRLDVHNIFGLFITPRISLMYRPSSEVTFRIGGGTGFKAPTIFVEEAEEAGFQNTRAIGDLKAERAESGSLDINWRTTVEDIGLAINAAAYLTALDHAVIPDEDSLEAGVVSLRNATGRTLTRGGELSTKLSYDDFKLNLGYTYLYATQADGGSTRELELNPRHSFGAVLMWESEEAEAKVGLEAYWTGEQRLDRHPFRTVSPAYWITGLMAEKGFGNFRLFINFENFLDTRQTRYDPIILGDPELGNIRTLPVYAPLEGRVINGGVRFVL